MSLATILSEVVLFAAGAYGYRQQRHWLLMLAIVAGLAGSVVSLAQFYVTRGIWWFAPWDLLLVPAASAVVGLALSLSRNRLGPSDAKFDRDLYACLVELHDILDVGPADQGREVIDAWTAKAYGRATTVLNRLERMTPPSREWNELLDAYSALTRKTVAAIPSGVTPDQRRRLLDEGGELSRRYEDLRAVLRKRGHR